MGIRNIVRNGLIDVAPLKHRDLRLLLTGRGVSFLGGMVTYVAIPFQIYELTHSSFKVGLLGLAEIVPLIAAALVGGALADAHDRRRQTWITELGLMACSAGLLANASLDHPRVGLLYAIAALMATLDGLQ